MSAPDTEFINILGASSGGLESPGPRTGAKSLPDVLPVLGLSDIVIFPGMVAPLLVESAQSIRLIDDVVAGDRFLTLVLQRSAEVENPVPEDLFEFGCAARVLKMLKFPDNTVRVLVEGLRRCQIKEYTAREPYLIAKVRSAEGKRGGDARNDGAGSQCLPAIPGNHQSLSGAFRPGEDCRSEQRTAGQACGFDRGQSESQS